MVSGYIPPEESKKKLVQESRRHLWDAPYLDQVCADGLLRHCVPTVEGQKIIEKCHTTTYGGHYGLFRTQAKIWQRGFYWTSMYKIQRTSSADVQTAKDMEGSQLTIQCP